MLRLAAALLLFMLAGPSLLFEQYRRSFVEVQAMTVTPVRLDAARIGPLELLEAWQLSSPHDGFGGVSAMVMTGPRRFALISDAGTLMRFTLSARGEPGGVAIAPLPGAGRDKGGADVESAWRDPQRGTMWAGYEGTDRIVRFDAGLTRIEAEARPRAMRFWSPNGGAEALTRLADGRWLVLAEKPLRRASASPALLFTGDPADRATPPPLRFRYAPWGLGRPTDAATLPDGRVLLLHRGLNYWRWFTTTLAIGDPNAIRPDTDWTARPLAAFGWPLLSENFEAMAIAPHPRGLSIWLASDDNFSPWQRTLLIHLLLPTDALPPR